MAKVIERRGAASHHPGGQTRQPAGPRLPPTSGDAANDATLGYVADLDDDSLRAARGFRTAVAIGAILWVVVGTLVWLALR